MSPGTPTLFRLELELLLVLVLLLLVVMAVFETAAVITPKLTKGTGVRRIRSSK